MDKDFNVEKLDRNTLKFALDIAWKFEVLCKNTKEGRAQAHAYSKVQRTLQYYLQELDKKALENA